MFGFYLIRFSGVILEVTVTNDASIVDCWLTNNTTDTEKKRHRVIGLNCYTLSHKISTIQLCLGTKCLVLKLSNGNFPASLKSFLSDMKNTFVGIDVEDLVVSVLKREFGVCCNHTVFDIRELAERRFPFSFGYSRTGLKTIASRFLNMNGQSVFIAEPKKDFGIDQSLNLNGDNELVKRNCIDVYTLQTLGSKLLMKI